MYLDSLRELRNSSQRASMKFYASADNYSVATSSKIQFEEEHAEEHDSSSDSDGEETEIIRQLAAHVTFEERQKAKSNGSHSVYRKCVEEKKGGRANKNRPMEDSCKKPVSRHWEIIQISKKEVVRDPRFESLCGTLDVDGFRKRFAFLYEESLPADREKLKKKIKNIKDPKLTDDLKNQISWIDKKLKFESVESKDAALLTEHKKEERKAVKKGKKPFYIKKSEITEQRLKEKYYKLKESGKLDAFMEKRRKKNASKDHKFLPYRRPDKNE